MSERRLSKNLINEQFSIKLGGKQQASTFEPRKFFVFKRNFISYVLNQIFPKNWEMLDLPLKTIYVL